MIIQEIRERNTSLCTKKKKKKKKNLHEWILQGGITSKIRENESLKDLKNCRLIEKNS